MNLASWSKSSKVKFVIILEKGTGQKYMPDLTNNDRNRNLSFGSLPIDLEDHSLEEV